MYLDVPYEEKAKKELRARWDGENRLWYVDAACVTLVQAHRWLP
ncbi:DUF5710 domain-containing protein [Streptomyces sp. NPDC059373]